MGFYQRSPSTGFCVALPVSGRRLDNFGKCAGLRASGQVRLPIGRRALAARRPSHGQRGWQWPRMCAPVVQREFLKFQWRDYDISYRVEGNATGTPVLLVHGFGANIMHWRKNIDVLAEAGHRVYALDLLGFGASPKPDLGTGNYNLELWRDLCVDFIKWADPEAEWNLVGNSIGSLVSQMVAVQLGSERIRSLCFVNSSSAMVSFRLSELNPVAAFIAWLFNTILFNRFTGPAFFENFRTRENVASVLQQAYGGGNDAVSEELVSILCQPSFDEGATQVFLAVLNGPPGPHPRDLLPQLEWCPILALWARDDPFTPYEKGFFPGVRFPDYHPTLVLEDVGEAGHCPHDSRPEIVNPRIISFLEDPQAYRSTANVEPSETIAA